MLYPVSIQLPGQPTKSYSPEFQSHEQHSRAWKSVLQRAYQTGAVTCACPGRGEKQLAIKHYDQQDVYGLARFGNSGAQHAHDCRFFSLASGVSGYSKGVISEDADGGIRIRLGVGLTKRPAHNNTATEVCPYSILPQSGSRPTQADMKLLGLLHLLWDNAGLNIWWPAMRGKRSLDLINRQLEKVAMTITANRINLDSVLLLPAQDDKGKWAQQNKERVAQAVSSRRRLVAIVQLVKYSPVADAEMSSTLKIACFYGFPWPKMTPLIWLEILRRFPRAIAAWKQGHRVIGVALLDLLPNGKAANVLDLALMPVTKTWIPFDSMYELTIAEKLITETRGFIKPLRYDASEDVVFPDFVLLDMDKNTPLEVFGMTNETYLVRQSEKTAHYLAHYGTDHWWCWNAATDPKGENIPPFPERRQNFK